MCSITTYTDYSVEAAEIQKNLGAISIMDYLFPTKKFCGSNCPPAYFFRPKNYSKNNSSLKLKINAMFGP